MPNTRKLYHRLKVTEKDGHIEGLALRLTLDLGDVLTNNRIPQSVRNDQVGTKHSGSNPVYVESVSSAGNREGIMAKYHGLTKLNGAKSMRHAMSSGCMIDNSDLVWVVLYKEALGGVAVTSLLVFDNTKNRTAMPLVSAIEVE